MVRLAATLMVKNESRRIRVTLNSLKGFIRGVIIYDTGSTDNTLDQIQEWCRENQVNYHCRSGEFIDFSRSRNALFDFADEIDRTPDKYDFHLLLDCNDELQGGAKLLEECERFMHVPQKAFFVRQKWLSGTHVNKYLNSRLVKSLAGWRYEKRVHEFLNPPKGEPLDRPQVSEEVVLFQNRNEDDDKTSKRFKRDKELLLQDVKEFNDPRDQFYLAQTLGCLGENDEAFDLYQKRGENVAGFWEERFHSFLRSGEIAILNKKNMDVAIVNLFKALMIDFRAEPLVILSKIFTEKREHLLAYMCAKAACQLEFPTHQILFINDNDYRYERWAVLSVSSYHVGRYKDGREALKKCIETGINPDVQEANQKMYATVTAPDVVSFDAYELPDELGSIYHNFITQARKCFDDNDHNQSIINLIKAFQVSHQVTPLIMLAEYCRSCNSMHAGYFLLKIASQMNPPPGRCTDFEYRYLRWHLLGVFGSIHQVIESYETGKKACLRAIEEGDNIPIDKEVLKSYLNNHLMGGAPPAQPKIEDFKEFKQRRLQELAIVQPKMPRRQAEKKVELEWKLKK